MRDRNRDNQRLWVQKALYKKEGKTLRMGAIFKRKSKDKKEWTMSLVGKMLIKKLGINFMQFLKQCLLPFPNQGYQTKSRDPTEGRADVSEGHRK